MTVPEDKSARAAVVSDDAGASNRGRADRLNRWLTLSANLGVVFGLHDRASLAARYAPAGATILFNGVPIPDSFDDFATRYRDEWTDATGFGWNDLFFDVLGPDSVVVTGTFDWGTPDGPERYAYANILQRHDGEFRIRREVETRLPAHGGGPP